MLPTGSVLSHFRVERELGRGGMGIVYEATDLRLGRRVALKVIRPDLGDTGGNEAALHQLAREAQLAAAVSHPNLVTIYTFEREGGQALIAMELLAGQNLGERLRSGWRPGHAEAGWLLGEIAAGVAAAHAAGIVHLDLKPANVMVLPDGRVKVLDFGIARSVRQRSERAGPKVGTPAYMAPEQLRGGPVSPAADVWAIGAIGVTLLTGARPYEGTDPVMVAQAVMAGPPAALAHPSAPAVFGPLTDLLRQCLCEAEHRLPDAGQLLAALRGGGLPRPSSGGTASLRSSQALASRPTGAISAPAPPPRRPWILVGLAGAALVLLVGAGAAYMQSARLELGGALGGGSGAARESTTTPPPDTVNVVVDSGSPPPQKTEEWDDAELYYVDSPGGSSPRLVGEPALRNILGKVARAQMAHLSRFHGFAFAYKAIPDREARLGEAPLFIDTTTGVLLTPVQGPSDTAYAVARDTTYLACTLFLTRDGHSEITCEPDPGTAGAAP